MEALLNLDILSCISTYISQIVLGPNGSKSHSCPHIFHRKIFHEGNKQMNNNFNNEKRNTLNYSVLCNTANHLKICYICVEFYKNCLNI